MRFLIICYDITIVAWSRIVILFFIPVFQTFSLVSLFVTSIELRADKEDRTVVWARRLHPPPPHLNDNSLSYPAPLTYIHTYIRRYVRIYVRWKESYLSILRVYTAYSSTFYSLQLYYVLRVFPWRLS